MGKIRVKTLGDDALEKEQQKEAKKRQETKKLTKAPGLKGGERIVAVGPTEEELSTIEKQAQSPKQEIPSGKKPTKTKKKTSAKKRSRSKRYQTVAQMVDRTKLYSLNDALTLLPKLKLSSFDETVELHLNTKEPGISETVNLPHGSGKKMRIAIADPSDNPKEVDELIKAVEGGTITFDILLAHPSAMPKLAKIARILGPKGLMPNPKNGTISQNPKEAAKKFEQGQIRIKTEAKTPAIHLSIGKLSFGEKKLHENIKIVLDAVKTTNIRNVTLKSTMSPGIKIDSGNL